MIEKNKLPNRKRTRLKEYDYSSSAYYYATICAQGKRKMFGDVFDFSMELNHFGKIVKACWLDLPNHYSNYELDYYVIMPDHFHGILIIDNSREGSKTLPNARHHGLSEIIRGFKSFSSKRINMLLNNEDTFHWQRSFYDRIIRNEKELFAIRQYIEQNPLRWEIGVNNSDKNTRAILDLYNSIDKKLSEELKHCQVLITNIMLGVFGNTPAIDGNFTSTFRKYSNRTPAFRSFSIKTLSKKNFTMNITS